MSGSDHPSLALQQTHQASTAGNMRQRVSLACCRLLGSGLTSAARGERSQPGRWPTGTGRRIGCEPGGDATPVLEAGKGVLDAAALLVEALVMACWSAMASPSWDADAQAARLQLVAQPVGPRHGPRTSGGPWLDSPGRPGCAWWPAARPGAPARRARRSSARATAKRSAAGLNHRRPCAASSSARPGVAADRARPGPPPEGSPRCGAVRRAFRWVLHHHDRVALGSRSSQVTEHPGKDAQPRPPHEAVVEGLVRPAAGRGIPPAQAVPLHVDDAAEHRAVVGPGSATHLRNVRPQPLDLLLHTARTDRPCHPPSSGHMSELSRRSARGFVGPDPRRSFPSKIQGNPSGA